MRYNLDSCCCKGDNILRRSSIYLIVLWIIFNCAVTPLGANQDLPPLVVAQGSDLDSPPFDVDKYLNGPDHKDFPWEVLISEPILNYQQRRLLKVGAYVPLDHFKDTAHGLDLHFVLKVAAADKGWIPEYSYLRIPVPSGLDGSYQIQYIGGVHLRPGRYTIALIVYDAMNKQGNVWRKIITVPHLKKDPLPDLDRDLPEVEFISETPPFNLNEDRNYFFRWSDRGYVLDQSFAKGKEWLPLNNSRCMSIDIVVFANSSSYSIQEASVLSNLKLRNGRIRVTIADFLRKKMLFNRKDAKDFDWPNAIKLLVNKDEDPYTVDAKMISKTGLDEFRQDMRIFLHDMLQNIFEDRGCASEPESPKILIFLVGSIFFYYDLTNNDRYENIFELIERRPHIILKGPFAFRKELAVLISKLEKWQR